jgi:hypothetical protein
MSVFEMRFDYPESFLIARSKNYLSVTRYLFFFLKGKNVETRVALDFEKMSSLMST